MHLTRREILASALTLAGTRVLASGTRSEPHDVVVGGVVRPEFLRAMERVLICLPAGTMSFGAPEGHDVFGRVALAKFLERVFWQLLDAIPSYAQIDLVASRARRDMAARVLKHLGERSARIHLVDEPDVEIELWAQDLGERIFVDGRERFLVARPLSPAMGAPSKMSRDRKRVAELVFGKESIVEARFAFEGGNLAFDSFQGNPRVLVGCNAVSRTIADRKSLGETLSRRRVLEDVAVTFGGAEVVEMGREGQSPLLQHIDQSFVILDQGAAVANRIRGGGLERESRELLYYADQLRELGYRVFFLDHDVDDVEDYRSSINVVPFVDKSSGEKRILFPIFPGEVAEDAKIMSRAVLRGKAARAFDLYRDLGYGPSAVLDFTHPFGGNTHCILNVLS